GVFTGEAVKENSKFRFCWLVRFCHKAVIDTYREHPDHIAFANKLFRQVADDRISIDYQDSQNMFPVQLPGRVKKTAKDSEVHSLKTSSIAKATLSCV
ncbi:MAG: Dabb family protein, partial [Gammaproteobacteria bacterium]